MFTHFRHLLGQMICFGFVGALAFLIDYGCLYLLTEWAGINYMISGAVSFTVSVVFNYLASMKYVFSGKSGMSKKKEFFIFIVLSLLGLGINQLLMWFGVELAGIYYMVTKIFATAVVMVFNFVTRKLFLED